MYVLITGDQSRGSFFKVIFILLFGMGRLMPEQRLQIVKRNYENSRSVKNVFRFLRSTYGQDNLPTERTIRNTRTHPS